MDRFFTSFRDFNSAIHDLKAHYHDAVMVGLYVAAEVVKTEAKESIGTYQSAAGPFPEWAQLSAQTQREREHLGYDANRPLERTGELRDSYEVDMDENSVIVGSALDKALDLEVGDPAKNLPARSILGRAFVVAEQKAFDGFANEVYRRLQKFI
jgi:hypothetical protein